MIWSTTALLSSHFLARRGELSGLGLRSLQALVAVVAVALLLQQRHAGAAHGDGHVDLRVRVAAADAGAHPLEDDGGSVDRSAAVLVALLAVRAAQAALTQAVRLGDVAGIPGRVVRDPDKQQQQDNRCILSLQSQSLYSLSSRLHSV